MKKRKDNLCEKKIWVPLPSDYVIDKPSKNIRYNKEAGRYEKRKSLYNSDKRLLNIEANEIQNQINKGTYVPDSSCTFEQNINKWFESHCKTKAGTTKESYGIYRNHAVRLIGGEKRLQDIKPSDIKDAYNNFLLEKDEKGKLKHSKNSLKHLHTVVNMSFEYACENGIITKNPCKSKISKPPQIDKFESYVYSEDEFNTLLQAVKGTEEEVIVLLAGGVGLRAGEICGLKWNDLDFLNNSITISRARYRVKGEVGEKAPKSKNSKRIIAVDPYILEVINNHPNGSEYVLCRSTKNPYRNDEIYHKFADVLTKKNLPKTRLHDLRHYNATMMAFYEVDIKTAAERLGDNVETVLKVYQHVKDQMNRKAAEKLGNMFKDKPVVKSVVIEEKQESLFTTEISQNPLVN